MYYLRSLMKKLFSFIVCVCLSISFLFLTGCQKADDAQVSVLLSNEGYISEIDVKTVQEKLLQEKDIILIDVRTVEEYKEAHLGNAILIPLQTLEEDITENKDISKNDEIIVYCRSGKRSMQAYELLKLLGYKNVSSMAGGIKEWKSTSYKVCKGEEIIC